LLYLTAHDKIKAVETFLQGGVVMIASPKVKKHLARIKKDRLSSEELRELLKAIARDFQIPLQIASEVEEDDFWVFSPEDEQRFNDLLCRSTKDLKNKSYTEYEKPRA